MFDITDNESEFIYSSTKLQTIIPLKIEIMVKCKISI